MRLIAAALVLLAFQIVSARAADPDWLDPALLAAAKGDGAAVIFSSVNEEEELPQLQRFEEATGIHVDYVRASDTAIMARIAIEARAGKAAWDVVEIQAAESIPKEQRLAYAPPEAAHLMPGARDPEERWVGGYTVFHAPGYNTTKVAPASLPQTYADFAKHQEWAGHVAIDYTDRDWLAGMFQFYGEDKGNALVQSIVAALHPALYKGHLALARALGSGEYWITLNNFVNLTINVKLAGGPVDYWVLEPVVVTYGQIAANVQAPHPNAAKLLLNYLISAEAETMRTKWGRIPTRADVATNPPGIFAAFQAKKTVRAALSPAENEAWQKTFNALFKE
ncbi:MAG TPA: ABC transporter substrate-binding protein [Stellaceae bacterium]|nr:ABC transporter substrate-binding protein [Stellaceae bacterium]